jgi:SAM-dependent methyltransferase
MAPQHDGTEVTNRQAFSEVYQTHEWLGNSKSGPGSDPQRTIEYRQVLQKFLREHHIRKVLDLGCGDWSFSRLIDWDGIDYVGVDVVQSVVESNQSKYGRPNISFRCIDAARERLPEADLLIAKEVLQHLPIADVEAILAKAKSYPFALFVNDLSHEKRSTWKGLWKWKSICTKNSEVRAGGYRPLALREAPFSLAGTVMLTYENQYRDLRWTKEVLLWSQKGAETRARASALPSV